MLYKLAELSTSRTKPMPQLSTDLIFALATIFLIPVTLLIFYYLLSAVLRTEINTTARRIQEITDETNSGRDHDPSAN